MAEKLQELEKKLYLDHLLQEPPGRAPESKSMPPPVVNAEEEHKVDKDSQNTQNMLNFLKEITPRPFHPHQILPTSFFPCKICSKPTSTDSKFGLFECSCPVCNECIQRQVYENFDLTCPDCGVGYRHRELEEFRKRWRGK